MDVSPVFGISIVIWSVILLGIMLIGGFFMFRKFLKSMPKKDGKSDLDWQDYYIEQTLPLWNDEGKQLLNELVEPVPSLFRDTAKKTIAAKIGELALKEKASEITQDLIIRGYIEATPRRDHKFLIKRLEEKNIDYTPYQSLLE
ncbi:MAG: DUF2621 domain-containing protein [Bacillaceae bacterium]|nr:DUF2621 domain-containing protein [Bacillaceae bacterium]